MQAAKTCLRDIFDRSLRVGYDLDLGGNGFCRGKSDAVIAGIRSRHACGLFLGERAGDAVPLGGAECTGELRAVPALYPWLLLRQRFPS